MSDIVRDNEFRALARMQVTYDVMRTIFPADREIMSAWCRLTKETQALIDMQEASVKERNKDLT